MDLFLVDVCVKKEPLEIVRFTFYWEDKLLKHALIF